MLNKRESEVMNAVYSLCCEKGICLISPAELLSLLPQRKKYDEQTLEKILDALALDNYFELLSSERKGGENVRNFPACRRVRVQALRAATKAGFRVESKLGNRFGGNRLSRRLDSQMAFLEKAVRFCLLLQSSVV